MTHARHVAGLALVFAAGGACPAGAQLDPLLFLKSSRPTVLVALDLSSRMQRDLRGAYHDPAPYSRQRVSWERTIGVDGANTRDRYRRRYPDLRWLAPGAEPRAIVSRVEVVGDDDPAFEAFDEQTRLGLTRSALVRAVESNTPSVRFGLIRTRQASARFDRMEPASVAIPGADPAAETDTGTAATWRAVLGSVDRPGGDLPPGAPLVSPSEPQANAAVLALLRTPPFDRQALVPAGFDTAAAEDAPLAGLLDDLHAEAARLAAADGGCRNTVAVLVAGGGQSPALQAPLEDKAWDFLRIAGRRVPIHVIALAPDPAAAVTLSRLASRTGGHYVEVRPFVGGGPAREEIVSAITRAVNAAVQHGFSRFEDFNGLPSPEQPLGPVSEYPTAPPVVGTVNLENAVGADGQLLPGTRVLSPAGVVIPQESNVVFTTGLAAPGFDARVRALRVYRPQPDDAAATGHRFVADGTHIWTATVPHPDARNIFTVLPGRGLVPFAVEQSPGLAQYLRAPDAARLIADTRRQPLGAATTTTPALLTPPGPMGSDPAFNAFAEAHGARRTLLFVGLDDGMMHAFDARTGVEVWAVIPFNLLPKLRLLREGQPVDRFHYFVGGPPRIADVRTSRGWRTLLLFGEGPGGTFYQAFDVTLDGIDRAVPPDADRALDLLQWFADPVHVPFLWAFPSYADFDAALGDTGDLAAAASPVAKSVGESWSTPAVLEAQAGGPFVVFVGSGPLSPGVEGRANRGGVTGGSRAYLLDAESGLVLDQHDVGSDGEGEIQDGCPASGCARFKNALAADPVVLLPSGPGSRPRAYMGDLDGRLWRVEFGVDGGGRGRLTDVRLLFDASADHPLFASVGLLRAGTDRTYVFFGSGGDQLTTDRAGPGSRVFGLLDTPAGVSTVVDVRLQASAADGVDERLSALPAIAGEVVFFATTATSAAAGCQAPEARLYGLSVGGGAAYDSNGDGRRDGADRPVVAVLAAARASPPTVADRHLFLATGGRLQVFGARERYNEGPGFVGLRVLSWREVK